MALAQVLLVAKFLRHLPTWVLIAYVAVAALMAVGLTVGFLASARTREPNRPGGAGPAFVLVILFFPLMAISMIWPITLPIVLVILLRRPRSESRGFEILRDPRSAVQTRDRANQA